MLESIKTTVSQWIQPIYTKVLEVESTMSGASGAEKLEAVANAIAAKFDIPYVPAFIEDPMKRAAIKYLATLAVEKLNWIFDWNFKGVALSPEQVVKLASVTEAPIPEPLIKASSLSLDERIETLLKDYQIQPEVAKPVEPESETVKMDVWGTCMAFVSAAEGGKNYTGEANGQYTMLNPADKGGPTNRGITKDTLLAAYAQGIVGINNLDTLTREEAEKIYKANYWDRYRWGEIPHPVCLVLFDMTVNHGGGGMAKIVQRAANALGWKLEVDGKFGPKTFESIQRTSEAQPKEFAEELLRQRKQFYDEIVARDETQKKNLNGWYNRIKRLAEAAGVASPV